MEAWLKSVEMPSNELVVKRCSMEGYRGRRRGKAVEIEYVPYLSLVERYHIHSNYLWSEGPTLLYFTLLYPVNLR